MSDISDITTLVRSLVQDFSRTQSPGDIFTYTTSAVFTLSETNVIAITDILINDSAIGSSEYSFDSSTNKVTITATLTTGDTVEIKYTYYCSYSDTELEEYIRGAVVHLSANGYCTFQVDTTDDTFYPDLTLKDKNIIGLVASIMIKPDNVSYRLPDISFTVQDSMSTNDLIRKAVAIAKHNTHGDFSIVGGNC